jgi:TolB-like protein
MQATLILLVIGFPVALILAWSFEMSPAVIRRTHDVTREDEYPEEKKHPGTSNWVIAFLVFLVLSVFIYRWYVGSSSDAERPSSISDLKSASIAVLPLINLNSADQNLAYFSNGVTQEIIDELAKISSFTVTAFSTTLMYQSNPKPHAEIAQELDVDYLISGTSRIFADGDSVRLSIELIDPESQKRMWNSTFNEEMKEAPTIQLAIARQVADRLDVKLTSEENASLNRANTSSGEAFNLFLRAKSELATLSNQGFLNSVQLLEESLSLDPAYAQAHTLLAWTYVISTNPWFGNVFEFSSEELVERVEYHIERSIELDPQSSDIFLVRGNLKVFVQNLLRDGLKDVDYAIEMNSWPITPTNYCICTVVSTYIGLDNIEGAWKYAELARDVDPGNVFIFWDQANILMKEGKYKEAQDLYNIAAEIAPIPMFQMFLGWNYYHVGEYEMARDQLLKSYQSIDLAPAQNVAYLSNTYLQLENVEESDRYKQELEDRLEAKENFVHLPLAMVAMARGEIDEALDLLEESLNLSEYAWAFVVSQDPIFEPIHDHPRFISMRAKAQYFEPLLN